MALHHFPRITTDGLVLCLDAGNPLSYTSGDSVWKDLSGNGNDGTIYGTTFNSTHPAHFDFNGSSNYISVNYSNSLQITNEITLVSIFSPDVFGANRARLFDTKSNDFADNTGGSFGLKMGTTSPFQDISFFLTPDGFGTSTELKKTTSIILSTSQIYHVVARWRKSDGTSNIFVNGTECSYITNNSFTSTLNTLINPITIGKLEWSPDIYGDQQIYCSLIYNRYLSNNEIVQNFNATKGRYGL
jgi:hypothetical protein